MNLSSRLSKEYNLTNVKYLNLNTPTNDVYAVKSNEGKFALKIYQRAELEIKWEIDLLLHLIEDDVPIVKPVKGLNGYVVNLEIDGHNKFAILFEWAEGEKPNDSSETYYLLGEVAAKIHNSTHDFLTPYKREAYSRKYLIDEQIKRMSTSLKEINRLDEMIELGNRLAKLLEDKSLDYGVCHMDLKPDNVHIHNGNVLVFDFDSAGMSWRAIEPYRILTKSEDYFQKWLDGYRENRRFGRADEDAVSVFVIVGDLRNTVWHLGFAESSRGKPSLDAKDLNKLMDKWQSLESELYK